MMRIKELERSKKRENNERRVAAAKKNNANVKAFLEIQRRVYIKGIMSIDVSKMTILSGRWYELE